MADAVAIRIKADAKQAQRELKGLGGSFTAVDKSAVAAGVAFAAAGAAIVAMGAAALKNAANVARMGDQIAKSARIVGLSGEQFQVLAFAAERSGVAMSSVSNGLKRLSRSMFDAQRGSKQAADTFKGMGIAVEDSNGELRDSFDVLKDVADRMRTVGVTSRTTAEAQVILGRSGADLTNLLLEGSAGLQKYEDRLHALGGVMSKETLAASEAYEDSVTDLTTAVAGLKREMGEPLIEVMTDFNEKAADGTSGVSALAREFGNLSAAVLKFGLDVTEAALSDIFGEDPNVIANRAAQERSRRIARQRALRAAAAGARAAGSLAQDPQFAHLFPSANADPAAGGGGGDDAASVAATLNMPTPIDTSNFTAEVEKARTDAHLAGIAERFMWDKADHDKRIELQRQLREEFLITRDAQVSAASQAFAAVEQFAGIAQRAVEDSYFGQTKAGRIASKALFVTAKAAAIAGAVVNTALAITNGLATPPAPLGAALAVAAGIAGATQIGTIAATTIQGLADAGLPPGALRQAGLNNHTAFAIRNDEMVIDPKGTSEISRMMELQRRQMEMGAMGGANTAPVSVQLNLDGRRVTEGLAPHMTERLEDGHDFRRNVRMGGVA